MQDTTALRAELIETARGMNLRGINVNKSGNVSARACRADGAEGFLITPTGMPYESLTPDDLVWIPLVNPPSLRNADGARRPSSEWEMHARVYLRRSDIDAVVHTHSCFATALACQDMPIPPFHYMVAAAGGHSIDVAPYATFGTPELARVAAEALAVKNACLFRTTACSLQASRFRRRSRWRSRSRTWPISTSSSVSSASRSSFPTRR